MRMTPTADPTIAALRATHDELADVVRRLDDDQLLARSGASDWSVAQVLSHLGSGAEIAGATLRAAVDGTAGPGDRFNESVWERWNALSPRKQADGFLVSDAELVGGFEALAPEQRAGLQVHLGFLPAPLPLATYAGMRLNEAAQHSWDVRVAYDDHAAIDDTTSRMLVGHLGNGLAFLVGFSGRADVVAEPALVGLGDLDLALSVTDAVALVPAGGDVTASFVGPADAVARLLSGRLTPRWTPDGVSVSGNIGLDDLRAVFPGY